MLRSISRSSSNRFNRSDSRFGGRPGEERRNWLKRPLPRNRSRTSSTVQRSPIMSSVRAIGQSWLYGFFAAISKISLHERVYTFNEVSILSEVSKEV